MHFITNTFNSDKLDRLLVVRKDDKRYEMNET